MREPYWGYYNEEELQEWFDMWEEQLYYEENVCSLNNKQEGDEYDYGSDETNKFSQEHTKTLSVVREDESKEEDQKCTM